MSDLQAIYETLAPITGAGWAVVICVLIALAWAAWKVYNLFMFWFSRKEKETEKGNVTTISTNGDNSPITITPSAVPPPAAAPKSALLSEHERAFAVTSLLYLFRDDSPLSAAYLYTLTRKNYDTPAQFDDFTAYCLTADILRRVDSTDGTPLYTLGQEGRARRAKLPTI